MQSLSSRVRGARTASTSAVLGALLSLSAACAPTAQRSMSSELVPAPQAPHVPLTPVTLASAARGSNALDLDGRSPRHTIVRAELDVIPAAANAYDLITRLRPEFLRGSYRQAAFGSETEPVVYLDALKAGRLSTLQMIPTAQVLDITYVTPVDALLRFGPTHGAGAIVVRTRQ